MSTYTGCFVVEPTAEHLNTVILLHGRGSDGEEFAEELFECKVPRTTSTGEDRELKHYFSNTRWIFPTASPRTSTVFQEEMTEWFDTYSLTNPDDRPELQSEGLAEGGRLLKEIVHAEANTIGQENMVIGGISQGFAVAGLVLMALDVKFAGFVGLSGWIPRVDELTELGSPSAAAARAAEIISLRPGSEILSASKGWNRTPIFIGHEEDDPIVACDLGKAAARMLNACGADAELKTYPDSDLHWISEPDELEDMTAFLSRCLRRNIPSHD